MCNYSHVLALAFFFSSKVERLNINSTHWFFFLWSKISAQHCKFWNNICFVWGVNWLGARSDTGLGSGQSYRAHIDKQQLHSHRLDWLVLIDPNIRVFGIPGENLHKCSENMETAHRKAEADVQVQNLRTVRRIFSPCYFVPRWYFIRQCKKYSK